MNELFLFLFILLSLYLLRYILIAVWNFMKFYRGYGNGESHLIKNTSELIIFWISISYFIFYIIK